MHRLADLRARPLLAGGVALLVLLWVVTGLAGRSSVFGGEDMFKAVQAGTLVAATGTAPPKPDAPLALSSRTAGLRVTAVGELERVHTKEGWRRPYEGSRLIGFRIADGSCEKPPCESWRSLKPVVVLDGETKKLPGKGRTFALLAPPGVEQVDLVVDADGFTQSLSLLDGTEGEDRIVVLDRPVAERHASIDQRIALTETTSIGLDGGAGPERNQFVRDVTLTSADLRFFLRDRTPTRARDAFLVLTADYGYRGRPGRYRLWPGDVTFVDPAGHRYPGLDLDPAADDTEVGFEVPGSVRRGTLELGGTASRTSTTGTPYEATLQSYRVPVTFG
ncbi:MAG: hypothetical protein J7518_20580 [Nocardioidaceae bacterium]|nr:hypothetical protein [Nocardioidaceae bacterium]